MSTPRYVTSCWRTCKRLRRTNSPSVLIPAPLNTAVYRYISVSSRRRQEHPISEGIEEAGELRSKSKSEPSEQKSTDTSRAQFGLSAHRPQDEITHQLVSLARARNIDIPDELNVGASAKEIDPRLPRSVQALYLRPLRRKPTHNIPVANLQLRSYSVRNLEFVADFALRAAYYLNLPAKGPVPLPRITERWTVPKSNFIFKKTQQNFERVTVRRLVQVLDGEPEVVQRWLAFVRKWAWYGVGMKADVFEFEDSDVVKRLDATGKQAAASGVEGIQWEYFGRRKGLEDKTSVGNLLEEHGIDTRRKNARKTKAIS